MQSQKNPESYQRGEHLVDERNLDFIAVWNPSMLEQLVGSLIRNDWKLTTEFFCFSQEFFCYPHNDYDMVLVFALISGNVPP